MIDRLGVIENGRLSFGHVSMLPVHAIHIPQDDAIIPHAIHPGALRRGQRAVGRARERDAVAERFIDDVVGALQFVENLRFGQAVEQRVVPRVIADLVALRFDLLQHVGMTLHAVPSTKKVALIFRSRSIASSRGVFTG